MMTRDQGRWRRWSCSLRSAWPSRGGKHSIPTPVCQYFGREPIPDTYMRLAYFTKLTMSVLTDLFGSSLLNLSRASTVYLRKCLRTRRTQKAVLPCRKTARLHQTYIPDLLAPRGLLPAFEMLPSARRSLCVALEKHGGRRLRNGRCGVYCFHQGRISPLSRRKKSCLEWAPWRRCCTCRLLGGLCH